MLVLKPLLKIVGFFYCYGVRINGISPLKSPKLNYFSFNPILEEPLFEKYNLDLCNDNQVFAIIKIYNTDIFAPVKNFTIKQLWKHYKEGSGLGKTLLRCITLN